MLETVVSLIAATALLLGSPGPVPLALAATSAVFGFCASLPFLLGILVGLALAMSVGAAGLTLLFSTLPSSGIVMQVAGALYSSYVAWKIATAPTLATQLAARDSLPTYSDGLILNLLNPKAYAAFLALFSQFLLPVASSAYNTVATAVIVFVVAIAVDTLWLAIGGFCDRFSNRHDWRDRCALCLHC